MLRNPFEKKISQQLKRKKIKFENETERIPYFIKGDYIPDFILHIGLSKVYVECKGYLRREDKRKLTAVVKQHPEIDLRILFYRHNAKDIKWAEKMGLKYAISNLPKDWFDERPS